MQIAVSTFRRILADLRSDLQNEANKAHLNQRSCPEGLLAIGGMAALDRLENRLSTSMPHVAGEHALRAVSTRRR